MFPWKYASTQETLRYEKKADNNIQGANFKVPFGDRFAQKLEKSFKNRIHWLNSPFSKNGIKTKIYWHRNYSFNLLSTPITLYYSMQRTNEPLKERNHSKWVKHFFYIYTVLNTMVWNIILLCLDSSIIAILSGLHSKKPDLCFKGPTKWLNSVFICLIYVI